MLVELFWFRVLKERGVFIGFTNVSNLYGSELISFSDASLLFKFKYLNFYTFMIYKFANL